MFMIGVSSGAITTSMIDAEQKKELVNFLNSFMKVINEKDIDSIVLIKQSLKNNLQTFALLWFLGATVIGIPLVIGLVLLRGFIIGFTVGFIVKELGFRGIVFSTIAILPQNIIYIPWIIFSSALALIFAIRFIKNKFNKGSQSNYGNVLISYSLIMGILFIVSIAGTLIEAYITPILMKLVS